MESVNRRTFLKRAGVTAAAVGAVAAGPGIGGIGAAAAGAQARADASHLTSSEITSATPVVAHVRDARTGEIALFVGEREITIRDRSIAARLVRASR